MGNRSHQASPGRRSIVTDSEIINEAHKRTDLNEREAFLAEACRDDPEQRQRIEARLAMTAADTFRLGPGPSPPPAPHQTHVGGLPPTQSTNSDNLFSFVQPAARPGSIGRLDHYELTRILGQGAFGIVFLAIDDLIERTVAIKVISPALATDPLARKRFIREARTAGAIRHANVVQILAIEAEPIPYLVMEYVAGESLQTILDRDGAMGTEDVVRIGLQIARGLAAAHERSLIHRDIKPGNILIEPGPGKSTKITDFGLARAADDASLTATGMVAGTPAYMAPEQAQGLTLDHRTDLFSFGSVLYSMCTGQNPFRAMRNMEVMQHVVRRQPTPIQELVPTIPKWLIDLVAKLHAKAPADRYQSAAEVADEFASRLQEFERKGSWGDSNPKSESNAPEPTRRRRWRLWPF